MIFMTSILTNSAALAALGTLRMIDSNMDMVQRRISSGYKVGSASDNSAYWSIATTMRSDSAALSTTQDALGLAAAKADTSYAGLSSAIDILTQVKAKLVGSARTRRRQGQDQQGSCRTQEPAGLGGPIGLLFRRELALQHVNRRDRHQATGQFLQQGCGWHGERRDYKP